MAVIRFVYFDAGGTLIAPTPSVGAVYAEAGVPHGLEAGPDEIEQAFRESWPDHIAELGKKQLTLAPDEKTNQDWWRPLVFRVLDHVSFEGDREIVFQACYEAFDSVEAWRIHEDVPATLSAFNDAGTPMGVLSNWDHRLPALLEELGFGDSFDPVLVSALEGLEKPDIRFFELACERVELAPEEILYVGDNPDLDLHPAREIGIRAYLIDRKSRHRSPFSIDRLEELVDLAKR
jgi:putative hydrolase of the HAD superfamily